MLSVMRARRFLPGTVLPLHAFLHADSGVQDMHQAVMVKRETSHCGCGRYLRSGYRPASQQRPSDMPFAQNNRQSPPGGRLDTLGICLSKPTSSKGLSLPLTSSSSSLMPHLPQVFQACAITSISGFGVFDPWSIFSGSMMTPHLLPDLHRVTPPGHASHGRATRFQNPAAESCIGLALSGAFSLPRGAARVICPDGLRKCLEVLQRAPLIHDIRRGIQSSCQILQDKARLFIAIDDMDKVSPIV